MHLEMYAYLFISAYYTIYVFLTLARLNRAQIDALFEPIFDLKMSTGRDSIRWTDRCEGEEEWEAVFNLGLGEEDTSASDATLEDSKDNDAAS